ncbi:hypothetical protein RclHR1_03580002 [Rhizophagus clarus]|uniref:SWIM-type domain-containing protein n=1 Tax=Rhizophagus clarus TaxID=94130 RepID=A0A2Z6RB13_9GLOM|nr:hypothetical protein RclHR1_03580002 [Rhizophagus clarus]
MFYEVAPYTEPTNHVDNNEEYVVKSILGTEFEGYVDGFLLIKTPIEIEVGTSFHSMEIAVHFIEQYALQNNFAVFKHKSEKFPDGTYRKRVFKCDLGGRYTEKLSKLTLGKKKSKGTKKQGCMWQLNINRQINSPLVTVTSFNNEHNHKILINTIKFSTSYKNFTEEIMEQIEFYVVHGQYDAGTIRNLLQPKLAAQAFIQDEKQESYEWLLRCCLEACEIPPLTFVTDADSAMVAAISTVLPETHHMQCLYHLYQNLPKNLRSCLGSSLYQEFLKDFKAIQRSHCVSVFKRRSVGIVEKYEAGGKYITTMLLNRKHTWVKYFASRHFTAGIQSTQLQESTENRLEFESINNCYSIWKSSTLQYTQPFVIQMFFKDIDIIMKKYLTHLIHNAHYKQMCQSVCYRTHQVPFSEILTSDDDLFEPFFDKEVDDSIETLTEADEDRELDLKSLISMVNSDDILEIWKVSRYNYPKCYQHVILLNTGEYLCTYFILVTHGIICRHFFKVFVETPKAYFHLILIPKRWYKDEYITSSDTSFSEIIISSCQNNKNDT